MFSDCEFENILQDYCSNNPNGTFRVITENIPCGTTGTTCSKAIKLFLGVGTTVHKRLQTCINRQVWTFDSMSTPVAVSVIAC